MDADGLPLVGPGIDYTRVEAIQQKRTIAFINHFISHTASFLNRFSCVCEEKLELMSNRLQQLEISMSVLEAKLSSIPGLENVTVAQSSTTADTSSSTSGASSQPAPQAAAATTAPTSSGPTPAAAAEPEAAAAAAAAPAQEEVKPQKTVSQDPRYSKFFKMLQVGVPQMALRNKMLAEGLNPDLLDTPDAPAPEDGESTAGGGAATKGDSDSDDFSDKSDSGSDDFSD